MKVLILSVTAGYGHISTANAIAEEFKSRGAEVLVEDLYQEISRMTYEVIDKGYLLSVKNLKTSYKRAYRYMEMSEQLRKLASFFTSNKVITKRISRFLNEYMPDCIISTHPFAGLVISKLKEGNHIDIPSIGVITDYCIHPGWEDCTQLEYIVTASELLNYVASTKSMDLRKIVPLGIPVRPIFRHTLDKISARKNLGLLENKRTVLLMGGSMGYGDMMSTVSSIDRMNLELQLVCICGRNEKLRKHLSILKTKRQLVIHGFVNNVDAFMDAADCVVTKPGGLTVTEALCKKLPLILVNPIPGHEEKNVAFLLNNGAAMRVDETFSITEAMYFLFSGSDRLQNMQNSIEKIAKPYASVKICDLATQLCT